MSVFSVISTSNIAFYSGRAGCSQLCCVTDSDSDFDERGFVSLIAVLIRAGVAVFIRTAHKFAYG